MTRKFAAETIKEAQALIDQGYHQTSRKYRHVARLPEGKTGIEALAEASAKYRPGDALEWATRLGEQAAGGHFRRVYAVCYPGLRREVSEAVFAAFKALGGKVA